MFVRVHFSTIMTEECCHNFVQGTQMASVIELFIFLQIDRSRFMWTECFMLR